LSWYFLESSAFAKLFILEEGSEALIHLLQDVDDSRKLLSALAPLEVRSAIRRRERSDDISSSDADRALENVARECLRIIEQPVTATVVEAACAMLDIHPLRALDALQLATCIVARETLRVDDIHFASSDEILMRAAKAEGFAVLNPISM
jgi:predicted nucleic acid-binding protein